MVLNYAHGQLYVYLMGLNMLFRPDDIAPPLRKRKPFVLVKTREDGERNE